MARKDLENEERLYKKTLKRLGLEDKRGTRSRTKRKIYAAPERTFLYSREEIDSLDTGFVKGQSLEDQRYRQQVSSQYEIGQAFNKGGYQVLSKKETSDESTGKRR